MSKGIIFNIQKFSIHDGPGIRTTVFLKGCPLKCKWCSNPESQSKKIQVLYHKDKCGGCKNCVQACPQNLIHFSNDMIYINSNCIGCFKCIDKCPNHALTNEGEYKDVKEVLDICLQDKAFYEESNGGVTISGGEGMLQPEFVMELLTELKKENIHVAIETTGYINEEIFKSLAIHFDLLLFDVKHYDSNKHFEGTGVHNELIIKNLKWAINSGINVLPRIPVIPRFNLELTDALGLSNLLKSVGAKRVQLLPFHQFGEKKYELLNKKYELKDIKALRPEDLKDYQQIFINNGLDCFF